jgi:hypothetical protein
MHTAPLIIRLSALMLMLLLACGCQKASRPPFPPPRFNEAVYTDTASAHAAGDDVAISPVGLRIAPGGAYLYVLMETDRHDIDMSGKFGQALQGLQEYGAIVKLRDPAGDEVALLEPRIDVHDVCGWWPPSFREPTRFRERSRVPAVRLDPRRTVHTLMYRTASQLTPGQYQVLLEPRIALYRDFLGVDRLRVDADWCAINARE